jgi:hypothetical protein
MSINAGSDATEEPEDRVIEQQKRLEPRTFTVEVPEERGKTPWTPDWRLKQDRILDFATLIQGGLPSGPVAGLLSSGFLFH